MVIGVNDANMNGLQEVKKNRRYVRNVKVLIGIYQEKVTMFIK